MRNLFWNLFSFILAISLGLSCNQNDGVKGSSMGFASSSYQESLKQFPAFLVDFFPKLAGSEYFWQKTTDTTNKCIYFIYYDLKDSNALSIDSGIQARTMANYTASEKNLITIKSESLLRQHAKYYHSLIINNKYYYPVPFFETDSSISQIGYQSEEIFSSASECGLNIEFNIYVLDSKPGIYWKGLTPSELMPEGWKNGYSKGICVNAKRGFVIYWFIIW